MGIFDFGKKDKDNKNQSGLVQPPISGGNSQQTQNDNQGNNLQSQSNANTQYSSNSNNLTQSQNYSNQQNLNTNINQENFADPTPLNDDFSQIPQPVLNQNVQNVANQQDDFDPLKWQQELEMQKNSDSNI
ncbi:MAG: hypothetical protein KatS3mg085_708 [Candidatus Dojkabacteria bacterium]|nr:MAG: hypothetical protein KatS3mg085_708 [Candidatus Dojkabacteria bacterium]